ncbi:hypothetical protein PTSG_09658 [Salpingoeca rosetta]|uniref:STEEP1 domain-containing protein n=1 Tax=Salpingoeca rosetta (strain ATCC 50818 / BSB-021) TaxID=946362 RepID=F2ULM1_SALR5|nr:uncharacterized protein PTSG_09658 [Salpingoeca rosetta]EGD78020.1 hypothetical protein PTSG_09658 [Salpingoeca rosetta]|eukprot:XP_004990082.1 hypothetical protein PTSG_09658 [Salpingoeca rosetta]
MPRRGIISTDRDAVPETDVPVYYCLCGHLALISEKPIETLPKRNTDGAAFFDGSKGKYSLNMTSDETIVVRREKGVEVQYCLKCNTCGLPLAYQTDSKSKQYFLRQGALLKSGETSELAKNLPTIEELEEMQASSGEGGKDAKKSIAGSLFAAQYTQTGGQSVRNKSYEADAREVHRAMNKQHRPQGDEGQHQTSSSSSSSAKGTLLTS